MHHFFDPSIKPIISTDLDGNIIKVVTRGLEFYGYPNLKMENNFELYEPIFYSIIDRIFNLNFRIEDSFYINGKEFKLQITDKGYAAVIFPGIEDVTIITIFNPISRLPMKFITKGMHELYNHPEAEIDGNEVWAKEILAYFTEQVKKGTVFDESCCIEYEENIYEISYLNDRLGKALIQIGLQKQKPVTVINQHKKGVRRHLQLVK